MAFVVPIFAAMLLVPAFQARADLEAGEAAFRDRDYKTAYRELLPLAESGDAAARYALSKVLYFGAGVSGRSVEEDEAVSKELRAKAAEQGHPKALRDIADDYHFAYNYEKAFEFSLRAAQVDGVSGSGLISFMYCFGEGVPRDSLEADAWYVMNLGPFAHNVEVFQGLQCEFGATVTAEYLLRVNRRSKEIKREYGLPSDL